MLFELTTKVINESGNATSFEDTISMPDNLLDM